MLRHSMCTNLCHIGQWTLTGKEFSLLLCSRFIGSDLTMGFFLFFFLLNCWVISSMIDYSKSEYSEVQPSFEP